MRRIEEREMARARTPEQTKAARTTSVSSGIAVDWDEPEVVRRIRDAGLRPTTTRRWIVALLTAVRAHPTVDELQHTLEGHGRGVRQATLYQNLSRLAEAGVISSFLDAHGLLRFDGAVESHPHLTCIRCGRIADLEPTDAEEKRLDALMSGLARAHTEWSIAGTRLELRALCPACTKTG